MNFLKYIFTDTKQRFKVYGSILFSAATIGICRSNDYSLLWAIIPSVIMFGFVVQGCWNNFNGKEW